MPKYYVIDNKEMTASQLVDRLGKMRSEIKQQVKEFEKLRGKLLKGWERPGKIMGGKYVGTVEIYDLVKLDDKKLKKHVDPKILKKCYSVTKGCKRLKLKAKST